MTENITAASVKNYELLYIVANQYTEDELKTIKEKVNSILKKYGAELGYSEFLGKKRLAYPINKVNHGYYLVVEFELADPTSIKSLANDLKLDKEVLRAQIIAKPKITQKEIERQARQRARAAQEDKARSDGKPALKFTRAKEAKKESKKVDMKQLDEKLEEILKDDIII